MTVSERTEIARTRASAMIADDAYILAQVADDSYILATALGPFSSDHN